MDFKLSDKEISKIKSFVITGIIVLTFMVVVVFGIKYVPSVVTVTTSANAIELPIYSVDRKENKVSLSFEVGNNNKDLRKILDILATYDVKATFFINGVWLDKYSDDVKTIIGEGHDIGNHSENHKHMSELDKDEVKKEILELHTKVKELTGVDMKLFRAPYGDFDNNVITISKNIGYYPIQWNVDSRDWKDYGVDSIIKSVLENDNLSNGSIVRFHVDAKYTTEALGSVIEGLEKDGYELVPVSELIYTTDYYVDTAGIQMER